MTSGESVGVLCKLSLQILSLVVVLNQIAISYGEGPFSNVEISSELRSTSDVYNAVYSFLICIADCCISVSREVRHGYRLRVNFHLYITYPENIACQNYEELV